MWRESVSLALLCAALPIAAEERQELPQPDVVPGYQQLAPRGVFPALVDPDFVSAADAEIPDDAWVLGFASEGEAYAYDLELLNSHEVVNHRLGERNIAAVW